MRRFVLKGGVPDVGMLTAGSRNAEETLSTRLDRMAPTKPVLGTGKARRVAVNRREVSPERVKMLLEEAKKRIEEAKRELDRIVGRKDLAETWRGRILGALKHVDPGAYRCYMNPSLCETPKDVVPANETILRSIQGKMVQINRLASAIKRLAGKIEAPSAEENPAVQLDAFYSALVNVISNLYRTRPDKLMGYLNRAVRDLGISLTLLKQAVGNGARMWSRKYCSREGCITASNPVEVNGRCTKYELVALKFPSFYERWYESKYGRPLNAVFAAIVPTHHSKEVCMKK